MQNTNQLITLLSVLIIIVYIAKNAFIILSITCCTASPIMENARCRTA